LQRYKQILQNALLLLALAQACNNEMPGIATIDLEKSAFAEIINANGTIRAVNTITLVSPRVRARTMTVTYLADDGKHVKAGDVVCILDAAELTQQHEEISSRLEQTRLDLNKLMIEYEVKISLLESQLEEMEIRMALNSLDSIQQQFAPPVSQSLFALELEKASVEKLKLQAKYDAEKQIFDADRRRLESVIRSTENDLQRIADQISSLTLAAPIDGMVMHTEIPTMFFLSSIGAGAIGGKIRVNTNVWSNMALLQIPDLSEMEVSVEVPEVEYRRILPGQKVNIRVDALDNLKTTGEVKRKTLAGRTADHQSPVKVYEIIVSVDSLHSLLIPGLNASCRIVVNQVADTVVVPTLAVFGKDSLQIVYVAEGKRFRPVPVETGLSNSTSTIISSGLKGNETIALVEPPFRMRHNTLLADAGLTPPGDTLDTAEEILEKEEIALPGTRDP
jgi:HlyD family secretion protein